jgi:hypothetical protein
VTTFTANGTHKSVFVTDQPNATVTANGISNFADVVQSPDCIVRLDGVNNGGGVFNSPGAMIFLNGSGNGVLIVGSSAVTPLAASDDTVTVRGSSNVVDLVGETPGDVVVDDGHGTTFGIDCTDLTIQDFAHDSTGKIDLRAWGVTPAQAVAAEQSDGHGGTLLSLSNNGALPGFPTSTIDFAGDPHVDISHFV